jgi:hypothetical protein
VSVDVIVVLATLGVVVVVVVVVVVHAIIVRMVVKGLSLAVNKSGRNLPMSALFICGRFVALWPIFSLMV